MEKSEKLPLAKTCTKKWKVQVKEILKTSLQKVPHKSGGRIAENKFRKMKITWEDMEKI